MGNRWRVIAGLTLVASCVVGSTGAGLRSAHAAPTQALAYVTNGQVQVFDIAASTLTTVGLGQSPAWSPDGSHVLYMRPDFVAAQASLYMADSHGANTQRVAAGAYPYVNPNWSPDSKYVVYTAIAIGGKPTEPTIPLEVRALNIATKQVRVLGRVALAGGCAPNGTALQSAQTLAEGAYHGTPSTLIWAQPSLVVVQSSCTGQGLTIFKIGGKATTLPGWSGGVESPDGKTIAAAALRNGAKPGTAQVALINIATGHTQVLKVAVTTNNLVWTRDSKALIAVTQPGNTVTGSAQVVRLTPDGKTITRLGSIAASGAYHPSLDITGKLLALAVVANASSKVAVPPAISINTIPATMAGTAHPFIIGSQPSWRP